MFFLVLEVNFGWELVFGFPSSNLGLCSRFSGVVMVSSDFCLVAFC